MSFTDFLNLYRIETALRLLDETDKKITDIALESGFQSVRNFNEAFRKKIGISPSEYKLRKAQSLLYQRTTLSKTQLLHYNLDGLKRKTSRLTRFLIDVFKYIYLASTFPKIDKQHEIQFMRQEVLCRTVAVLFGRSYPVRKQEKLKTKPAIELSLWTRKFTIGHSDIKTTANIYGHLDISGKAIVLKTMKKVTTKK